MCVLYRLFDLSFLSSSDHDRDRQQLMNRGPVGWTCYSNNSNTVSTAIKRMGGLREIGKSAFAYKMYYPSMQETESVGATHCVISAMPVETSRTGGSTNTDGLGKCNDVLDTPICWM